MELRYVKGDLFKVAPKEAYLLHACNCQGAWGAGIAKAFKLYYPMDYIKYNQYCKNTEDISGTVFITKNNIICLFTSEHFGKETDSVEVILDNTKLALKELETALPKDSLIYSPKINSGLFATPWEDTEKLINKFLEARSDVTWVVTEL